MICDRKMMFLAIILLATLTFTSASYQPLVPDERRVYTYSIRANISTGTVAPVERASFWTLEGSLRVRVFDEFSRARFWLDGLKAGLNSDEVTSVQSELLEELTSPWEAGFCEPWLRAGQVSRAALNLQRALSYNFLLTNTAGTKALQEPCLYGTCISTYTRSGRRVRKYTTAATRATDYERCAPPAQWRWRPVRTDKSNYLFTSERDYYLDEKGLQSMDLKSSLQYNTYGHVLGVFTDMTIRYESSKEAEPIQKINLTEHPMQYDFHTHQDPSNGIWNRSQSFIKNKTHDMLLSIAKKGIDADNIVRNATLIHSLDFIDLLNTMSQLDYESLLQVFHDVLGTSYELETARNIFLEVLPYVRTAASVRLIKYLLTEHKTRIEDVVLLSLLRKVPYNMVEYNKDLLNELEVFTKLGSEYPEEIRHAGILSFATLVYKTMEIHFDQQYFDDIYDKYLRMFNYCPQYVDRLVWLQGLINIGKNGVNYLDEIYTDNRKDRHERLWAALASVNIWKGAGLENSLPILMNETEHIQLRIVALHAILRTPLDGRDFYNIHEYIKGCNNDQLQKFWHSTVQNLGANRFYDKYGAVSSLIPFLAPQLKEPSISQWATNNIIINEDPTGGGPSVHVMTVGGRYSGPPEMVLLEFSTGGDVVFDGALYIIAEGVTSNVFKRIQRFNSTLKFESVLKILNEMKIHISEPEQVHIDIIVKMFDKTIYATHIDQVKFDSWNLEDVRKSVEDFVRFGSHINQQIVYYPLQMVKYFPTEIGTPIRLHSTVVSFTAIRGNVTAPPSDDLSWRNDLHIRYQGSSVTTLSTDGLLPPSEHSVRIQQSMVVHLPIKLDVKLALANRSVQLTWTNPAQNGGVAMHSRTQLTTLTRDYKDVKTISPLNKQTNEDLLVPLFDCENPEVYMSEDNVLTSLGSNILSSLKSPHILMRTLPLFNPTVGSCGLILPARQLQTGNKLDLDLKLVEFHWMDLRSFSFGAAYALRYYKETADGDKDAYFAVTGNTKLTNEFKRLSLSMEYTFLDQHENVTLSLQNYHYDESSFDVDFTNDQTKASGELNVHATIENKDPLHLPETGHTNQSVSKLLVKYEVLPRGERDRDIKIHAEGEGIILRIVDLFKRSYGERWPTDLRRILDKLIDKNSFSNVALLKERNSELFLKLNKEKEIGVRADILTRFPPKHTPLQYLTLLGAYHVCHVNRSTGVSGKHLIAGDCTFKPSFVVIQDGDKLTIMANDNFVVFSSKEKNVEKSNELNVHHHGEDYIISSKTTGVIVLYQQHKSMVLIPLPLLGRACGTCFG